MAPCITISLIFQDLGLPHFRLVKHNVTEDEMELGRQVSIATSLSHLMNIMYHFIDQDYALRGAGLLKKRQCLTGHNLISQVRIIFIKLSMKNSTADSLLTSM